MSIVIYIFGGVLFVVGVWFMRKIARELTRAEDHSYRTNEGRFIRLPRSSSHRKRGF